MQLRKAEREQTIRLARRSLAEYLRYVTLEDKDGQGKLRAFPIHWPFIWRVIHELHDPAFQVKVCEKSRRMLFTNIVCAVVSWRMWRLETSKSGDLWSGAFITKNEDFAKLLLRRVRDIHLRLPEWMRRPYSIQASTDLQIADGGELFGLHAGGEGPRQEGYNLGFLDEFAFQENAQQNYTALAECVSQLWIGSTPNGEGNLFYDLTHDKVPGVKKIRLHYSEHPERKPGTPHGDLWQTLKRQGKTKRQWQQEQEIDYTVFLEDGWMQEEWNEGLIAHNMLWDPKWVVTRGWDFGYRHPACVWSYIDDDDVWNVRFELLGNNITIDKFAQRVLEISKALFPGGIFRDAGDPAATQNKSIDRSPDSSKAMQQAMTENTDYGVLFNMGIELEHENIPGTMRRDRHSMVRQLMKLRADKRFGLQLDAQHCPDLIKALQGGYRRPKGSAEGVPTKSLELETPNPTDDKFVHLFDAFSYPIVQYSWIQVIPAYDDGGDAIGGNTEHDAAWLRQLSHEAESRRQAAGI